MSDPIADAQLELACRLGSVDDIAEAIGEGADVNCKGCSPLFCAIQAGDRAVVAALVRHGADVAMFEVDPGADDVVDQLMQMAPANEGAGEPETAGMAELDAKMVRAFQRMLVNKGLAEPILKGRRDEYPAFADGLRCIAAEECHAIVREFLGRIEQVNAGAEDQDDSITSYLKADANSAALSEICERYRTASEDEQPGELLKDYLKEQKKVK